MACGATKSSWFHSFQLSSFFFHVATTDAKPCEKYVLCVLSKKRTPKLHIIVKHQHESTKAIAATGTQANSKHPSSLPTASFGSSLLNASVEAGIQSVEYRMVDSAKRTPNGWKGSMSFYSYRSIVGRWTQCPWQMIRFRWWKLSSSWLLATNYQY